MKQIKEILLALTVVMLLGAALFGVVVLFRMIYLSLIGA